MLVLVLCIVHIVLLMLISVTCLMYISQCISTRLAAQSNLKILSLIQFVIICLQMAFLQIILHFLYPVASSLSTLPSSISCLSPQVFHFFSTLFRPFHGKLQTKPRNLVHSSIINDSFRTCMNFHFPVILNVSISLWPRTSTEASVVLRPCRLCKFMRHGVNLFVLSEWGGSVAEWLACWTQAQKGLGSNRSRDAVG